MTRHIVALSGGKDSTAMSLGLKLTYPNRQFEYVTTPTGDELPDMQHHWERLETLLGSVTKLADITLFELIEREDMIPNFRARFCTRVLKIEPFLAFMDALPTGSTMYVGLRADEEDRLGIVQPDSKFKIRYPLRDWNWGINEVLCFLRAIDIEIPERTDCGVCFFQRLPEWKRLLEKYPERYESYVQVEKKRGHTFRTPGKDTWPTDLDGLRREILSGREMRNTKARGEQRCRFCSM